MKNRSSLFILGGIFIALMIFTAIQMNRPRAVAPPAAAFDDGQIAQLENSPNRIYIDWTDDDIQAVQLFSPLMDLTLTFSRLEDGWEFPDIPRLPDQEVIQSLARTISILPFEYQIDGVQPAQYPEFGLTQNESVLFIQIIRNDGNLHIVAVGDLTSTEDGYYALVDDRREVYVIQRNAIAFLLYYLREFQVEVSE